MLTHQKALLDTKDLYSRSFDLEIGGSVLGWSRDSSKGSTALPQDGTKGHRTPMAFTEWGILSKEALSCKAFPTCRVLHHFTNVLPIHFHSTDIAVFQALM